MKTRIITACVLVPILILVCIFSATPVFPIVLAFINFVGVFEMLGCTKLRKNYFLAIPLYIAAVIVPFGMRYFKGTLVNHYPKIIVSFLLFVLYILTIVILSHGKYEIGDIFCGAVMSLYIIGACSSTLYLRDLKPYGNYLWIFIFIGAWVTDIFAYFTGVLFGKHKLIPKVSPKKTVEGSIGGIIFCILGFILYGIILRNIFDIKVDLWLCGIIGCVVSVVSQIGDLSLSVIKRHYGIKDYGKIFPGHGGVLDRFDSIMAVSVVLSIFCTTATPFM